MFKISDFSKLSRVSVKALRYYDELGLLRPAQIDRFTSYRYYSMDQLPRLNRILALKDLGLSLEQIARLLDKELPPDQLRGMLKLKQAELEQQADEVQERLVRVEARLRQIEQEGKMPKYDVVIKKVEPQLVASVRDVVPTPPDQGRLWGELDAYLGQHKVRTVGPCLTLYHDTEYKERDWDLEVCEPLGAPIPGSERVHVRELPGVETMACVLHRGDFANVGETYNAMMAWIQANDYHIVGSNREVYLQAVVYPDAKAEYPASYLTDKEENRLTEIQFPVEKA
jgi:DNA-binding transcriptional MerR regulator